jgi:hypothetical protein
VHALYICVVCSFSISFLNFHSFSESIPTKNGILPLSVPTFLCIHNGNAYARDRAQMNGWAVANSSFLGTTITLKRLSLWDMNLCSLITKKYLHNFKNRCIRGLVRKGSVRGMLSSVTTGEAAYSIVGKPYFFFNLMNSCPCLLSTHRSPSFSIQLIL